ncbi:unnamed protein product [Prunus brigantina]
MPFCPGAGKKSWPEVVGQSGEDAAAKIERENHNVRAIVILEGSATTLDRRCDRVWVWVNRNGIVTKAPKAWPEVVGHSGEDAAAKIERENHNVRAIVILEGSPATKDLRCDRVRVWINRNGVVITPPHVG